MFPESGASGKVVIPHSLVWTEGSRRPQAGEEGSRPATELTINLTRNGVALPQKETWPLGNSS